MSDQIFWPLSLLKPRRIAVNPSPSTISGPASLSGFRQNVASPAGRWSIAYDRIAIGNNDQRLVWRALAAQIEGRATPIILPLCERSSLRPLKVQVAQSCTYSDSAAFGDGSTFALRRCSFFAKEAALKGSIRLTTTMVFGAALQPGQNFSIGHRLYRIKAVESISGADTTFTFWPSLRDDVLVGAELDFDAVSVKARLVDDRGLDLMLDTSRYAFASVSFMEDIS